MKRFLLSIVLVMLMVSVGWAKYWYVAPSGTNGDGSESSPWVGFSNIVWGSGGVDAGDTLWLMGDFNVTSTSERLTVQASNVTIRGDYNGQIANVSAIYETVTSWTDNGDGTYSHTITGEVTGCWEDEENIDKATSTTLTDGNWYATYSSPNGTLYYKPTSGVPSDHSVTISRGYYTILVSDVSNVTIKNIKFHDVEVGVRFKNTGSGHMVSGCSFERANTAIQILNSGGKITCKNCSFSGCSNGVFFIAGCGDNNIVEGCTFHDISYSWVSRADGHGVGIQKCSVIVKNNHLSYGHRSIAIWGDSSEPASGDVIEYNVVENCDSSKYADSDSRGIYLMEYVDGAVVRYNKVKNCNYGIIAYGSRNSACSIVNNTVLDSGLAGLKITSTGEHIHFYNNLVNNCTQLVSNDNSAATDIILDYNSYYPNGSTAFKYGGTDYNFLGWQTATSQDTHSMTSNPLLTSTYHLTHNSPCIDTGTKVTGIHDQSNWKDLDRHIQRYGTAPDIGCYEYNSDWSKRWGMHGWNMGRWGLDRWRKNRW